MQSTVQREKATSEGPLAIEIGTESALLCYFLDSRFWIAEAIGDSKEGCQRVLREKINKLK